MKAPLLNPMFVGKRYAMAAGASMVWLLPALSAILVIVSLCKDWANITPRPAVDIGRGLWLLVASGLAVAGIYRFGGAPEFAPIATTLVIATVASLMIAALDGTSHEADGTLCLALSAGLASVWAGNQPTLAQIGSLIGIGISAALTRSATVSKLGVIFTAVFATDALGRAASNGVGIAHAGSIVAILVALTGLLLSFIKSWPTSWLKSLVCATIVASIGYLIADKVAHLHESAVCAVIGAVVAWISEAVLDSSGSVVGRRALVGVLWVAASTVAFGLAHGFGIGLCIVVGAAYFALVACDFGLLCMGPALGLAMVRVLRELHPDASRALDLGQHYAIVGLALGLALPLLIQELGGERKSGLSGLGWTILGMLVPACSLTLTGAKGAYGLVVGVGLSALFALSRARETLLPVVFGSTLAAISIVEYGWLVDWFSKSRNDKLHLAVWLFAGCLVACAFVFADSRRKEVAR